MGIANKLDQLLDTIPGGHSMEGRRGVANMCKIARILGYKDPMYNGAMENGAYTGDLLMFLEDNPGCIEAMLTWVGKQRNAEWEENISAELPADDDEDDED